MSSIRTPSATSSRSTSTSRRCCLKDDASHGFDNVSNGELSPTLLERYLAAAQKVSRAAVGSPLPSPASHVVVLPSDLTQEDHLDGLPFGTRGGVLFPYTFPQHAVYEIQVRWRAIGTRTSRD